MSNLENLIRDYIAESGLARLDPNDRQFFDGMESVHNENGIYWLAHAALVMKLSGEDYMALKPFVIKAVDNTRKSPGLFNRNYHYDMLQSFDNYLAMACLCDIYGLKDLATEIHDYGKKHFWNFNNTKAFIDYRAQHQGGEIQIYKLVAGHKTNPFYMIWFLIGMTLGLNPARGDGSQAMLQFMRLHILKNYNITGVSGFLWRRFGSKFMDKWVAKNGTPGVAYTNMFGQHPMALQAHLIK